MLSIPALVAADGLYIPKDRTDNAALLLVGSGKTLLKIASSGPFNTPKLKNSFKLRIVALYSAFNLAFCLGLNTADVPPVLLKVSSNCLRNCNESLALVRAL